MMPVQNQFDPRQVSELENMPVGRLLAIAGRFTSGRFANLIDTAGIPYTGWLVLSALDRHGELTQGDVASRCFLTPATITGVVDSLESAGLLTRARDAADRRVVRLQVTGHGRERVQQIKAQVEADLHPLFSHLRPEDTAVVRDFLITTIQRAIASDNDERTS